MVPHVSGTCGGHGPTRGRRGREIPVVETVGRVNAALIPDAAQALARLIERTGLKQVDVVNRALQVYDLIAGEIHQGKEVLLRAPDGQVEVVKIL